MRPVSSSSRCIDPGRAGVVLALLSALLGWAPAAAQARTLAKYLNQQGYRQLMQPRDVDGAGAVVELRDGLEVVVASSEVFAGDCFTPDQLPRTSTAATLETEVVIKRPGGLELELARVLGPGVDVGVALGDRRVRSIRVTLVGPFVESLSPEALEAHLATLEPEDPCFRTVTGAGRWLIDKALGVRGVTYRLLGKGGKEVKLDDELLGLTGFEEPRIGARVEGSTIAIGFPILFGAHYSAVERQLGFGAGSFRVRPASPAMLAGARMAPVEPPGPGTDHDSEAPAGPGSSAAIPTFPWPPPRASTTRVLRPDLLRGDDDKAMNLADVDRRLAAALDAAGYFEKAYYAVPGGFALVTRLEQIRDDGMSEKEPERWSIEMPRLKEFSLRSYLRALFVAPRGRYRLIVFVTTPEPFTQAPTGIGADDADLWLVEGLNRLPRSIGEIAFTEDTLVTALIYQFEWVDLEERPAFVTDPDLPARSHLERAKIMSALEP